MDVTILITGNTYPVKDSIKALGGKWDPRAKGWRVPQDKARLLLDPIHCEGVQERHYQPEENPMIQTDRVMREKVNIAVRFVNDSLDADATLQRETLIIRISEILSIPATGRAIIRERTSQEKK